MASAKTLAAYALEADKKVHRAQTRFPELRPLEAMFRYVMDYPEKLTPNTVGLWRQQMRVAVAKVASDDHRSFTERQVRNFVSDMDDAVASLKGRPSKPMTATKKWKSPSKVAVVKVFDRLKQRALALNRGRMAATALYCVLMPRLGGRPVELVGARVAGGRLIVPNAKRADGQDPERSIDVSGWDLHYRVALAALIDFTGMEVPDVGYEAWHKIMAETLARACDAVSVPRIAPSSFRHTALSTWAAAGFSIDEIARLAGHFSGRSPSYYIRTASSWGPEDVVVKIIELEPAPPPRAEKSDVANRFDDVAPMPLPPLRPQENDDTKKLIEEQRQRFQQFEDELNRGTEAARASRREAANSGRPDPTVGSGLSPPGRKP
nr:hypothetical protein [uncultured Devosia sp.]